MPTYRLQHAIQDINGLSKDRYVNTWYVNTLAPATSGELTGFANAVKAFYTFAPSGFAPQYYYASHAHGPGASLKIYEMTLGDTHPPIYTSVFDFPQRAAAPADYPAEVAICLSFKADPVDGVDVKSQRGRVYLGPLNIASGTDEGAELPVRPSSVCMDSIIAAAERLKTNIAAAGGAWAIYSPKLHQSLAPVYAYGVESASVDDAFDTQRRRGCAPTMKVSTTFP